MSDIQNFDTAFKLLNGRLHVLNAPPFRLVVCGGTALIATNLVLRTTRDVDIVAMADEAGTLIDPAPWPEILSSAAKEVAGNRAHRRRNTAGCNLVPDS